MKRLLLSLSLLGFVAAHADNIEVDWNHFADNGSFLMSPDFSSLKSGTLPPDGKQSVNGCTVQKVTAKNEFIVNCNGKAWTFSGSRFSCSIGGGGRWTAPDGSAGAYLCN